MIDRLRAEFGIEGAVCIANGISEMPMIHLRHNSGSRLELYLHGAHITSWKDHAGSELLFLSEKSAFGQRCAIRGGIPVVFPQFGDGALPKHGFARNMDWSLIGSNLADNGDVSVTLQLTDSDETRAIWNRRFDLRMDVVLSGDCLAILPEVRNTGDDAFSFQFVLHTYFRTPHIGKTAVIGLQGVRYRDALKGMTEAVEPRPSIMFSEETDRVYLNTPDDLRILHSDAGAQVAIHKNAMPDTVVWNPWIEKSKRLADFGDDEYLQMVCVETGAIEPPISLSPNKDWRGETKFFATRGEMSYEQCKEPCCGEE